MIRDEYFLSAYLARFLVFGIQKELSMELAFSQMALAFLEVA